MANKWEEQELGSSSARSRTGSWNKDQDWVNLPCTLELSQSIIILLEDIISMCSKMTWVQLQMNYSMRAVQKRWTSNERTILELWVSFSGMFKVLHVLGYP